MMTSKPMLYLSIAAIWMAAAAAQPQAGSAVPSDSEIRQLLQERIDRDHQGVGIVVGVIEPSGRRVVSRGKLGKEDERPLNGDTVFEIGSVTKVFTSLLLADMTQRNELALTDPVAKLLPAKYQDKDVRVPERAGKKITLEDLASHMSGLPRLPENFIIKDMANPYADYSVEQLYEFLSRYELTRDIDSRYEYSNLGAGLLGHALALHAGMSYEALVRSRICEPLGMKNTRILLTPEMQKQFAAGHNEKLIPVPAWDLPTLAGAGALRSSANDLLNFLAANLGHTQSALAPAMAAMLKVRRPTGSPGLDIGLGWHVLTRAGNEIVWHNGGTGGYRSFLGYSLKSRTGVVVLSNTFISVDDIGFRLLSPPLQTTSRKEVTVDPLVLDGYLGRYQIAPGFVLTITREGNRLFGQATGQSRAELFAENDKNFFLKVVDAQITFETDEKGRANQLVLHQNGKDMPAKRIEGEAPTPKEHKQIAIDPKLLDGYIGRYQLAPNFILTITRNENQLYAQATGQPTFEIFAESDHDFFDKVVDAQITFEANSQGRATQLILHQNGVSRPAKRIE